MANGCFLLLCPDHEYTAALQKELAEANDRVVQLQRHVVEAEKLVHSAERDKQRYHNIGSTTFYSR